MRTETPSEAPMKYNPAHPTGTIRPNLDREIRHFWEGFKQESTTFLRRDRNKSYYMQPMMDMVEREFSRLASRPMRILEIGCGDGFDTAQLSKRGHEVYAVDLAFNRLRRGVEHLNEVGPDDKAQFIQCSAEEMPFADNSFDLIYSHSVLLYAKFKKVIAEAHRILKPGGTVLFDNESMPHHPLLKLTRNLTGGALKREMERLVERIEPDKIQQEFSGMFSKIEHHEFFLLSPFAFSFRLLMNKAGLNKQDPNEMSYRLAHAIDQAALSLAPPLRKYCWVTVLQCTK
jgi:ubiquinone/menaquinone biosynthesis C-methylase UbiE